jgi:hypothetical protein
MKKTKEQFITELKKDSDRLYKLGCILNLTGQLYRTCLNWNDCSENVNCEDCYNISWQGWEAIYQFQHNENELFGYYPKLRPLQSFVASKPDDNIKAASKPNGKQWLSDWGLSLELAGLFDRGREFCCSLAQLMKKPESKASLDKWKEWQQLGYVKKFYDSTFELSKGLYQTPLGIIAYCDAKANPELRLLVLFCLLEEFRKMFIKHLTVNGPYNLNHGAFGALGEFSEEKAFGKLAIAPLGKIIHCQFKTQDKKKFDWDIITRGWAKYEERLFDLFNKMASDIEKFSIPLLALGEYKQEIESVLKIIRNGSAKWYPCKIEWTYLKNLDSVINGIRTKGKLLEIEKGAKCEAFELTDVIEALKRYRKSKDISELPPIQQLYDTLCRYRGQCGAKTTDTISWLGSATRDGSGYYPALLRELTSGEVLGDIERWANLFEMSAAAEQENKAGKKAKLKKIGRPRKYKDEQLSQMYNEYEQWYQETGDSRGAWEKVAKFHSIKSGDAARVACMNYRKKLKKST